MKIVFMGTPAFAVTSLSKLLESGAEVSAVVTAPDKPKGRGLELSESDVKKFAASKGLKVFQPANLKSEEFIKDLESISPELIVVVAFRILPAEVFELPVHGSINLHASLLPKYRGAAPINRAIMNGETETGVTTFFLKRKVDTGNIILQEKIDIGIDDNAGIVHDRLAEVGAELLVKTVKLIASEKEVEPLMQDDSLATPAPKIFRDDCIIDWHRSAKQIHDQIRGLSPYPGAFTTLNKKNFKIYASRMSELISDKSPGSLSVVDGKLYAATSDRMLELLSVQPEGKRRMDARDFVAGHSDVDQMIFSI